MFGIVGIDFDLLEPVLLVHDDGRRTGGGAAAEACFELSLRSKSTRLAVRGFMLVAMGSDSKIKGGKNGFESHFNISEQTPKRTLISTSTQKKALRYGKYYWIHAVHVRTLINSVCVGETCW